MCLSAVDIPDQPLQSSLGLTPYELESKVTGSNSSHPTQSRETVELSWYWASFASST